MKKLITYKVYWLEPVKASQNYQTYHHSPPLPGTRLDEPLWSRNSVKKYYLYSITTVTIPLYCNETNQVVLFTLLSRKTISRKFKVWRIKTGQKYFSK